MATDRSPRSPGGSNEPSRAEIQQRVSSLYDRAETDTGTYNATRAMSNLSRRTVGSVADSGRGAADPSLDAVAKQWFDGARDKIGPTTAAVLPADRRPPRPARSAPSADSATIRELEAAARRIPELTGPAAAAPPAAVEARRGEPRALEAAAPAALPAPRAALPAPAALPAAPAPAASPAVAPADRQDSLRSTKERIGRKLATAREMLARAVAQPVPSAQPVLTAFIPAQSTSSPSTQSLSAATAQPGVPPVGGPQQPVDPQSVQQPWDTAEQQAFRAEITAAWAGRPAAAPAAAPAATAATAPSAGPEGLLDTGGFSFAAPAPAFSASDIALVEPAPDLGGAELALGTPSFGHPIPGLGATAAESGFTASPMGAIAPDHLMDELGPLTPPSGYPYPEMPVAAPEFGFAAAGVAPAPAYPTSGLGIPAPAPDPLTAGPGYPTSVGLAAAPVAPLPEPVRPAAPVDATVSATGTAYLGKADKALAFARAQTGRPCVWGATGPESYDCSSLTQAAWKAAGVSLPRAAIDQAKAFTRISLADLRAGDLVFFFDDLSHVGLCTGNGMMIHAPGPGAAIREEAILPYGEGALRGAVRPA